MDIKQFNKLISKDQIMNQSYLFITEDLGLSDIYIKRLAKQKNASSILVVNSINHIKLGNLFELNPIYIYYSNKVEEDLFNKDYLFIQISNKIDKRTSIYKQNKNRIIEFKQNNLDNLIKYVITNSNLNENDAKDLINKCNRILSLINNELIKYNVSNLNYEVFKTQLYDYPKDAVFNLCNAIITKDESVYYHLEHCIKIEESPLVVLTVLSNNCKQVLQIQNCGNNTDVTGITNKYIVNQVKKLCGYRTNEELIWIIKFCNDLDMRIKKGLIDSKIVMQYIVIKIFANNELFNYNEAY